MPTDEHGKWHPPSDEVDLFTAIRVLLGTQPYGLCPEQETSLSRVWLLLGLITGSIVTAIILG